MLGNFVLYFNRVLIVFIVYFSSCGNGGHFVELAGADSFLKETGADSFVHLPRACRHFAILTISTARVPSTQVQLSIFCLYVLRIYGGYYPRLVLGDSHVSWLERFVSSSGIRFGTGSSVIDIAIGTDCHFKFAGYRGGIVSSVRDDADVLRLLDLHMPAIVVLCLAGNDVYGSRESVLTVGMRL